MPMEKIYSTFQPETLLHIICYKDDISERTNVSPDEEFLQVSAMKLNKGQTFKAHKHIFLERLTTITQESWLVLQGSVKCLLYDLDDKIIAERILKPGDCSVTFRGGHNYLILEEDTIVYEFKTGPYFGQKKDKELL